MALGPAYQMEGQWGRTVSGDSTTTCFTLLHSGLSVFTILYLFHNLKTQREVASFSNGNQGVDFGRGEATRSRCKNKQPECSSAQVTRAPFKAAAM